MGLRVWLATYSAGTVEAGEQGVQLHTNISALSFGKQSSFVWKNLELRNNLHTHILLPSTAPVEYNVV